MPRHARLHAPGALVHVIARFVNRQFRLAGPAERALFLEQLPRALGRSDWALCAYALMSSHVHLALLAGLATPERWMKSLHVAVARRLNALHGSFGPVFAERPTTVVMAPVRMRELVAYLHNNPRRAGLVAEPAESSWTSHRAWSGLAPAPPWLAVERGLQLAGFETAASGRSSFDDFVRARAGDTRDARLSGADVARVRAAARAQTRLPVELSSAMLVGDELGRDILLPGAVVTARWDGDLELVLRRVQARLGVSRDQMRSRRRQTEVVRARRVAALTAVVFLRREVGEVATVLALSGPAVSYLLRDADHLLPIAREVAAGVIGSFSR